VPTYDYECEKCGHRFEHFQKMSDELLKKCPKCGKKVHRLIGGGSGIIFKGTGFYETDYKRKPKLDAPSCSSSKSEGCKGCSHNKDKK
jgi:putative FmdB family regulatory protein